MSKLFLLNQCSQCLSCLGIQLSYRNQSHNRLHLCIESFSIIGYKSLCSLKCHTREAHLIPDGSASECLEVFLIESEGTWLTTYICTNFVAFLYKFCILEFLIHSEKLFFWDFYILKSRNFWEKWLKELKFCKGRYKGKYPSHESIPDITRLPREFIEMLLEGCSMRIELEGVTSLIHRIPCLVYEFLTELLQDIGHWYELAREEAHCIATIVGEGYAMIYWAYISSSKVDIIDCSTHSRDDSLTWEPGTEVWSWIDSTYDIGPDLSLFQCKLYLYRCVVYCYLHALDTHTRAHSESCLRPIRPSDHCETILACNDSILLREIITITHNHIYSNLSTHYRRCPCLDEKVWNNRIITVECYIVLICRVGEKEEKCRDYCEQDTKEEFLHERMFGDYRFLNIVEKRHRNAIVWTYTLHY